MQAAIATIRVGTTEGYAGSCLNGGYTPAWTLNNPSPAAPRRLLSPVELGDAAAGRALGVPGSVSAPCPDAKSLLRVDVIFYDDSSFGRAAGVQTWSNQ